MALHHHAIDLSSFEGPDINRKYAKPPGIPAHRPSVGNKKYDPSQATFENMGKKKGFENRILKEDLEKKESGCCSVM